MPTLGEMLPVTAHIHQGDLAAAREEFRYLAARRDQLTDKIRFGLIALNGGSLLALLSAMGGGGEAARWLGFTPQIALASAVAFATGLCLAGVSVTAQQNLSQTETGDAYSRMQKLSILVALHKDEHSPEAREKAIDVFEEYAQLPLTGFQYSLWSIISQNFSAGLWIVGILYPLLTTIYNSVL